MKKKEKVQIVKINFWLYNLFNNLECLHDGNKSLNPLRECLKIAGLRVDGCGIYY